MTPCDLHPPDCSPIPQTPQLKCIVERSGKWGTGSLDPWLCPLVCDLRESAAGSSGFPSGRGLGDPPVEKGLRSQGDNRGPSMGWASGP